MSINTSGLYSLVAAIDHLELTQSRTLERHQQQQRQEINIETSILPVETPITVREQEPSTVKTKHVFLLPSLPAPPSPADQNALGNQQADLPQTICSSSSPGILNEEELVAQKRRFVHNIMEKNRRANLKSCLEALKNILPVPTSHSGAPYGRLMSTSLTLVRAVDHIKRLESAENKHRMEVGMLTKQKLEMEEKVAKLMMEVAEVEKYTTTGNEIEQNSDTLKAIAIEDNNKNERMEFGLAAQSINPHFLDQPKIGEAPKNAMMNTTGGFIYSPNSPPVAATPLAVPVQPMQQAQQTQRFLVLPPITPSSLPSTGVIGSISVNFCNRVNNDAGNASGYSGSNNNSVVATTTIPFTGYGSSVNSPLNLIKLATENNQGTSGIYGKTLLFSVNNCDNKEVARVSLCSSIPTSRLS